MFVTRSKNSLTANNLGNDITIHLMILSLGAAFSPYVWWSHLWHSLVTPHMLEVPLVTALGKLFSVVNVTSVNIFTWKCACTHTHRLYNSSHTCICISCTNIKAQKHGYRDVKSDLHQCTDKVWRELQGFVEPWDTTFRAGQQVT